MKTTLRSILKDSILYAFSLFSSKIFTFFLIPIYTAHFTTKGYGIVETASAIVFFLIIIFKAGLDESFFRLYDKYDNKKLFSTLFIFSLFSGFFVLLLGELIHKDLSRLVFGISKKAVFVTFIVFFIAFFELISSIPLALIRKKEKSKSFAKINIFSSFINFIINILLIFYLSWGAETIVIAFASSSLLNFVCYLFLIKKDLCMTFDTQILKKALIFGLPLIPAAISTIIITLSDRYFLNYYSSLSSTGIYSLAYNLGMIVFYIGVTSFSLAWPAYFYKITNHKDGIKILSSLFSGYVFMLLFLHLSLITTMPDIFKLFVDKKFDSAIYIIPYISLSYCFFGIYTFFSFATFSNDKTHENAIILISSAVINLFLNYILIPDYGINGAASATLISYFFMSLIMFLRAKKITMIKLQNLKLILIIIISYISYNLLISIDFSPFFNIFLKLTLLLLVFSSIIFSDFNINKKDSILSLFLIFKKK